nr:MAG TPA: hypothetical protein [Caudoviricetes sp.]
MHFALRSVVCSHLMHFALSFLSFWRLKMGKTPSHSLNQPNYAFYRV